MMEIEIDYKAIASLASYPPMQELIKWMREKRADARIDLEDPTKVDSIIRLHVCQGYLSAINEILDLVENRASIYAGYIESENSLEKNEPDEDKGII